jgi:murein DD-endopeptidase MepM/ murein hydrolase activator NlpD
MQNFPTPKLSKITLILLPIALLFVSSCKQTKAPVLNRGSVTYDRAAYKKKRKEETVKNYSAQNTDKKSQESTKTVTVAVGENIYSISKKYNVPLRDLINKNNLTPPYILKVGDKINLPSNQYHQVVDGDTLYSISRQYEMNVNNLISLNDLQKPYSIKVGERLKINGSPVEDSGTSVAYRKNVEKVTEKELENKPGKLAQKLVKLSEPQNKNNRFMLPVKGAIISKFGAKPGGLYNDGIDIKAKAGDNVKATEDGVVAYVGNELRGYGNLVIIKHSGGWISAYGHLDKTKVTRGSKVKKGESIATVGTTGNVKFPQLYFGLRKGREAVNPQNYL